MSALLNGKTSGIFTVASMEFDSVVMGIRDVHKGTDP